MEDDLKELFDLTEDDSQEDVVDSPDEDVTDEGTSEEEVEEVANPQQQSQADNRIAASARREAEAKLREVEAQKYDADKKVDVLLKALQEFGYSGTPEEIADSLRASKSGKSVDEVKQTRIEEEKRLEELIENHPDVKAARERNKKDEKDRTAKMFESELANIQKLNPDIKSLADLRELGDDQRLFDTLIKGGMHIDEAYRHIMAEKTPRKAPSASTKSHIKTVNGSAHEGGTPIVPHEEREMIKQMMPSITDKEINDWYSRRH